MNPFNGPPISKAYTGHSGRRVTSDLKKLADESFLSRAPSYAHVLRFANKDQQRLVEHYLNSISVGPWVSGMAQPKLNQKALNRISVPWVNTIAARDFVADLHKVESLCRGLAELAQRKLQSLRKLKQSILVRAFSGQLSLVVTEDAVGGSP